MKFKSTWILFAVVLLLGAYAYFGEYKGEEREQKAKELQTTLVPFQEDQISNIVLQTKLEKIELVKTVDGWNLESPIKDLAENEAVSGFLSSAVNQKYLEVAKEGDSINWNEYGLEKPDTTLTFKSQGGESVSFSIGSKKNFESNSLIRKNSENRVLIVPSNWSSWSNKSAFEFRQKNVLRHRAASIDAFKIKSEKSVVEFKQKEGKWLFSEDESKIVDQNKVREVLVSLNDTKALSIVKEGALTLEDKKSFGLLKPLAEIHLVIKDKPWTAIVGMDKDKNYYVQTSEPQFLMKVDSSAATKFTQANSKAYRDKSFPFQIGKIEPVEVSVELPGKVLNFKKEGENWALYPLQADQKVDQDQLRKSLDKIKDMAARDFVSSSKNIKLDRHLIYRDREGKSIFELVWSDLKKEKIEGADTQIHYVKTNLSPEIIVVDSTSISSLGIDDWVKANDKKSEDAEVKKPGAEVNSTSNDIKK